MGKFRKIFFLFLGLMILFFSFINNFYYVNKGSINYYFEYIKQIQLDKKPYDMIDSYLLPRVDADTIFVTFYYKNKLRGCWGSPTTSNFLKNNIREDLLRSTLLAINDRRYEKQEKISDFLQLDTLITFLKKDKVVDDVASNFSKEYKKGYHSIAIENKNKKAIFLSYIPLQKHFSNTDLLKNLCIKAGMKSNCYKDKNSKVTLYSTENYLKNKNSEISRYNKNTNLNENLLDRDEILQLIKKSVDWLNANKTEKGFIYSYKINSQPQVIDDKYNYIRQLLAVRTYERVCVIVDKNCLAKNKDYLDNINRYYLSKSIVTNDQIELIQNGVNNPAFNAAYILYLVDSNVKEKNELITKLTNNMVVKINPDGTIKNISKTDQKSINIYYGEIYLALINAYKQTHNKKYLDVFEREIPQMQKLINKKDNIFLHWISQALYDYYLIKKDKKIAKEIIDLNIYLIDKYQVKDHLNKLNYGGFSGSNPSFHTGFVLETITDGYETARLEKDYANQVKIKNSIENGIRFMSQLWINESNSFYILNNKEILGAMMNSVNSNYIQIDYLGHSLIGLQKVLDSDIYEK